MDKFALVYEFNEDSPLITYKAARELEAGNYKRALQLLKTSLEKYPFYPTTYFMLATALAENKEIDKAKEMLNRADKLFNEKGTKDFYLNLIEKMRLEAEGINLGIEETVNEVLNDSFLESEELNSDDMDFDISSNELREAEVKELNGDESSIVTETLAEIYASQNNYGEAIEIYEKLLLAKPEKEEKIKKRISELKEILESKKKKK